MKYYEILKGNFLMSRNLEKPYMLIILHGMKNRKNKDIEIGIRGGRLANKDVGEWFITNMKKSFPSFRVAVDEEFKGSVILEQYRYGNKFFKGLGERLNIFQIELSRDIREEHEEDVTRKISEILCGFENKFVYTD